MSSNFGFNIGKSNPKTLDNNASTLKGGVRKESVDQKFHSIFDKVDRDKNGILDDAELANFKSEIDTNNNGNIEKKESKNYIKNNNLTYTNDKGKQKELSGEDLNQFLDSLAQNVDKANIKSATKGEVDGKSAVTITKNDGSQEIIFDDKNEPSRFVKTDPQTGETKTQFVKDGKVLKEETESQNGDRTATEFGDNGKPLQSTTLKQENGETSVTNYTDGVPTSKDITKGTTQKHYSIDQNGNEILETEVQDMGGGMKKTSTHTYDGNTETIATSNPDGSNIVKTKIDGKLAQTVETKAGETIITDYNEDGSKVETKQKDNVTTTTSLNADEHRTEQTQIVNGKAHTVKYDGKGNTQIVVRAGDSLEQIAAYMNKNSGQKVTVEDLKKLNPKVNNDNIQAGQMITVPGEYDAASKIVVSRGTQAEQKAKGDAAETRLNQKLAKLDQTYQTEATSSNYADIAKQILEEAGEKPNEQLVKKLTKQISEMNGNRQIKAGDKIFVPMTEDTLRKTINKEQDFSINWGAEEPIANEFYEAIKGVGTDTKKLDKLILDPDSEFCQENVAGVLISYSTKHPKEGLLEGISDEVGLTQNDRLKYINGIYNKLEARAKELDIDTKEYRRKWDQIDKTKLNNSEMDKIAIELSQHCISYERMSTKYEQFKIKSRPKEENYKMTTNVLQDRLNQAKKSFVAQQKYDGWAGRVADSFGKNFNIKERNYKEAVIQDMKQSQRIINILDLSTKTGVDGDFERAFKEQFGVEYNPVMVDNYKKLADKQAEVEMYHAMSETFNKDLGYLVENTHKEMRGEISLNQTYTNMGEINAYNKLSEFFGGGDVKEGKKLLDTRLKDMGVPQKVSKWRAMHLMAEEISSDLEMKSSPGFGSYAEYKTQLNVAYKNAFGTNKNSDILKRVQDYNTSQMVGASVVKTAAKTVAIAGTAVAVVASGGTATPLVVAGTTFAAGTAVDASDVLTSESRKLDGAEISNILKDAGIDAAMTFAGGQLGAKLATAEAFATIPGATISNTGKVAGRVATSMAGNATIGAAGEYAKKGKVTLNGVILNATFAATGEIIALSTSNMSKITSTAIKQSNNTIGKKTSNAGEVPTKIFGADS